MDTPEEERHKDRDEVLVPPVRRRRRSAWKSDSTLFVGTLVTALIVAAGVAAWLWLGPGGDDGSSSAPGTTAPPPSATGGPGPSGAAAADSALDLPPLDASDELVRRVAAELSERPRWAAWLANDGLVRRFVTSVVRVSAGSSPAERLEFMEPEGRFRVRETEGGTVVDPASYRRYDLPAAVVASLDTRGTARLYRRLHPLFEEAHRELGFEEGTFDEAFARAVRRLLSVEVPEGPVEVVQEEGVYRFRDPRLESLSPPAKHLIRMGPDNARRVQDKLRELAEELDLNPPTAARPPGPRSSPRGGSAGSASAPRR